ncbi:hypothetical protein BB558_000931 [Smittium angustum]|uniref:Pentacotripeptide-repeat region of PRORP domain-containing protein n=1 Tax=Smittium angustum TaxID=133377 RepID=A0A2U1JD56_SMIAN|nr:hypothetical protein BB558_000931 [Smittium angustum]
MTKLQKKENIKNRQHPLLKIDNELYDIINDLSFSIANGVYCFRRWKKELLIMLNKSEIFEVHFHISNLIDLKSRLLDDMFRKLENCFKILESSNTHNKKIILNNSISSIYKANKEFIMCLEDIIYNLTKTLIKNKTESEIPKLLALSIETDISYYNENDISKRFFLMSQNVSIFITENNMKPNNTILFYQQKPKNINHESCSYKYIGKRQSPKNITPGTNLQPINMSTYTKYENDQLLFTESVLKAVIETNSNSGIALSLFQTLYDKYRNWFEKLSKHILYNFFEKLYDNSMKTCFLSWIELIPKKHLSEELAILVFKTISQIASEKKLERIVRTNNETRCNEKIFGNITSVNKNNLTSSSTHTDNHLKNPDAMLYDLGSICGKAEWSVKLFDTVDVDFGKNNNLNWIVNNFMNFLVRENYKLQINTLNAYLNAHLVTLSPNTDIFGDPKLLFHFFNHFGVLPNQFSWSIVLNAIVSKKQYTLAQIIFDMMQTQKGTFPIPKTISSNKSGYSNIIISKIENKFSKSEPQPKPDISSNTFDFTYSFRENSYSMSLPLPNSIIFGIMIKMYANIGDYHKVFSVLEEMKSKEILPTSKTIMILMTAMVENNQLSQALKLFDNFKSSESRFKVQNKKISKPKKSNRFRDGNTKFGKLKVNSSSFLMAQHAATKLISGCLDPAVEIDIPSHRNSLETPETCHSNANQTSKALNINRFMLAEDIFNSFGTQFNSIFAGSNSGTNSLNLMLRFALNNCISSYVSKTNNTSNSHFKESVLYSKDDGSSLSEYNSQIYRILVLSLRFSVTFNVDTYSILLSRITILAKKLIRRKEINESINLLLGKEKQKSSDYINSHVSESTNIFGSFYITNNDESIACSYVDKFDDLNPDDKLLLVNHSFLVFDCVTQMERAGITPDINIIVHSIPPLLLLLKKVKTGYLNVDLNACLDKLINSAAFCTVMNYSDIGREYSSLNLHDTINPDLCISGRKWHVERTVYTWIHKMRQSN